MAKKTASYLFPIWVDITCNGDPKDVLVDLNEKLLEFFENYSQKVEQYNGSIEIQWAITQHIHIKEKRRKHD